MIIPKFHFFQIQREPFFGDAVELNKPFFSIAPEPFDTVDVDLAIAKMFTMVKIDMPVTTEHERIIAFEFVGINNAAAPDHLDRQIKQCLGFNILDHLHMDKAISLEDAEYGNLIKGPASSFTFALAPKVRFIHLNRPVHPIWRYDIMPDGQSNDLNGLKDGRITQADLLSDLAGGDIQFKELDDPQPLFRADLNLVQPSIAKVMEGVVTPLTTIPFTQQSVNFIATAPAAENVPFFPAEFTHV